MNLDISKVFIEKEIKIAKLSFNVNIYKLVSNLVIYTGGETIDISIISSNIIVLSKLIKITRNYLNNWNTKSLLNKNIF